MNKAAIAQVRNNLKGAMKRLDAANHRACAGRGVALSRAQHEELTAEVTQSRQEFEGLQRELFKLTGDRAEAQRIIEKIRSEVV